MVAPHTARWRRRAGALLLALVGAGAHADTPAGEPCRDAAGAWDTACLRARYGAAPAGWPAPWVDAGLAWQEMGPVPAEAPLPPGRAAATPAQVALGERLFFDVRLSRKGEVSCGSCHQPARAFTDGRPLAIGEDRLQGRRRTQTLLGAPFAPRLFWDGRAGSLEEQAMHPLLNEREMNQTPAALAARLATLADHVPAMRAAYGPDLPASEAVRLALAAYMRTLRPQPTRFDAALRGEPGVLDAQELLGLHLFRTRARCMNCHHGPLLSDHGFHDLGLSFYGRRNQDLGRFEVTRDPADLGRFKTPSLRNVARAGPWMHNGLFPDLRGLVRVYNAGMGTIAAAPDDGFAPRKSAHIRALGLTAEEVEALTAFLRAL